MRSIKSLLVIFVLALFVACGGDDGIPEGAEGGKCYGNGTCDDGLICVSDICVRITHPDVLDPVDVPNSNVPDTVTPSDVVEEDIPAHQDTTTDIRPPRDVSQNNCEEDIVGPRRGMGVDCDDDCDCESDLYCWKSRYTEPFGVCTRPCNFDCGSEFVCLIFSPTHWNCADNRIDSELRVCMPRCSTTAQCETYSRYYSAEEGGRCSPTSGARWQDQTLTAVSSCQMGDFYMEGQSPCH